MFTEILSPIPTGHAEMNAKNDHFENKLAVILQMEFDIARITEKALNTLCREI